MNHQPSDPLPSWLNDQFFEDIFVEKHQLQRGKFVIKVKAINPTGGTGENYTSKLYRANVGAECDDGNIVTLTVIIKAMLTDPAFRKFNVFTNEKCAYEKLLPVLEELWTNVGQERIQFAPRCWKTLESETDVIVLDDLCPKGYRVADRQAGLDMKHAQLLLAKLAKFHAASATDYRKNGPLCEQFNEGFVNEKGRSYFDHYYKLVTPVFLGALDSWKGHDSIKTKLIKSMEGSFDKLLQASEKDDSLFVALCHGDMWTNNHMYQYDKFGNPNDALMIDFQRPTYGSPLQDLFYFINSSTKLDLKSAQFDELIQFYHSQLEDSLQKLHYPEKVPTLRDIQLELRQRSYLAVQNLSGIVPIALADKSDDADYAGLVGEKEENFRFRSAVFNNPLYQTHLRVLLKMYDERGWLDH